MSEKKYRAQRRYKADDMLGTIKRILKFLHPYRFKMVLVFICITMSSLSSVASSYFFTPIINNHIVPYIGQSNPDLSGLRNMLILLALIYITGVAANYIYRKTMSIVSTGFLHDVRFHTFNKMQNMPVKFFDTHTHGELMNYYSNDIDSTRALIADFLPQLFSTCIMIVGVMFFMAISNLRLMAIVVGLLVLVCFITYNLSKISQKYFQGIMKSMSNINGYAEEMFLGQKVVKVFSHEDEAIKQFDEYVDGYYDAAVKANSFAGMLMPINANLAFVTYAIIAMVGAKMCIDGKLTLGVLASFLLYVRQISGPISNISQQFNGMMMSVAGAERVFAVIDSEDEVDEGDVTLVNVEKSEDGSLKEVNSRTGHFAWKDGDKLVELKGDIRLNNVTFWYEEGKTVLHNVSLYAKPGQKIAFVGSTGAGKTTITNLINRFYDVQEGEITYDGIPVNRIKKSALRSSLGVVLQDTNLFSGTVMENIRYGNLNATDEECIAAAKLSNADSFVSRLPDGYNTMLTANGANLSQGQRQLLNIARAAVADPPVLILDEATSSIDTHTEKLIEKGMDTLMSGRTVFVIAHRLSTVRNSNAIMVLEHGNIIERGNHDELLTQKGRYYQLYTGKAELD